MPPPASTARLTASSPRQCSINADAPHTENIEVHVSHVGMGMGMNPLALYAVADRLAQDPQHWKRFDVKSARKWFFKVTLHLPLQAVALVSATEPGF